jgi:hypothetical protein
MSIFRVSWPKASVVLLWWLFTLLAAPIASAAKSATNTELANSQQQAAAETLVPEHFHVPNQVALPAIKLVKVDPAYAEQDYQALMAARLQIRQALGTDWPADNLILAENKASLVNDLSAFNQRTNFTYHLLDPASGQLIGCLYISQSGSAQYQATVYYWLIPEFYQSSAHLAIRAALTQWINSSWPFATVDYSFLTALPGQPGK